MVDREAIADRIEAQVRMMGEIAPTDTEFTRDVHMFDYGYLDSFGAAELVAFVENTFSIGLSDDDLAHRALNTVNEIAAFVFERARRP